MSAIDQYINLYRENREAVERHSAAALNALRPAALSALEKAGRLPEKGDEGFEKTSVEEMFAPDFGVNVNRVNIPVDVAAAFRCDVPNLSTLMGIIVNDRFVPTATLVKNLPEGLTVCSFSEAAAGPLAGVLERHLGTIAPADKPGVALNTLLAQDGVLIHAARGFRADKPVQLVSIFNSPAPLLAPRRVLVVAEEGSSVSILKCDHSQAGARYLSSEVVEIFVGNNAEVNWYDLEESNPDTARYSQLFASLADDSRFQGVAATLTNGVTRNEFHIALDGSNADCHLAGMAIGSARQHIDNTSEVTHRAPHGRSDQLFKYSLDDNAQGAFEGGIEVCPGARFTEAFQTNRNILASAGARMHSKPQLLIYNDDVKCSHGAATGQLDGKALFYMRQRGIPEQEARTMLMQAFMVDVIDSIRLESLRDRLRHLVECRFSGHPSGCADCAK
ncbi:MAG: Fe-S cluster assembly protein SufD [Muribaculaceae bacterium]|nr:Fe-S cluster assembly protein SufD [Muribaculaceae bacterium]MDE7142409.1 Fe-S cluster assembly protein SufD [Muribaculaceae bacterium]